MNRSALGVGMTDSAKNRKLPDLAQTSALRRATCGLLLAIAILALVAVSDTHVLAHDKGTKSPDLPANVVAKWDWTVLDENDKLIEKGSFIVRGFAIYKNNKRIGMYNAVSETQVAVDISEGRLKGKLDLRKEDKSAVNWKGELARERGGKYKITVVFEKQK